MTATRVLVTGGAGFIGSHIVDLLLARGYDVTVFDNLDPQVHGPDAPVPDYLHPDARFIRGDVRDREALARAVRDADVVYHEAAAVGVGQSMYEVARYVEVNTLGGAVLLDILANERHTVRKLIVASSMSIYGEGRYACATCGPVSPRLRPAAQLQAHAWEVNCPRCGKPAEPHPTDEDKPLYPTSVYAVTKRDHEEMFLSVGRAYNIPTVALRYFNVYGPRQALSNPYTGVAAIFSGRLLNEAPPVIFEDGAQTRDFVHVSDIARANLLALESDRGDYEVFNVGTGRPVSIRQVAETLAGHLAPGIEPEIVGKFREGDIRHCYADIGRIQERLGYTPQVRFEDGMVELIGWVRTQRAADNYAAAARELERRGLTH
jgi:dTDP-L-rhamnose 4-epimerase